MAPFHLLGLIGGNRAVTCGRPAAEHRHGDLSLVCAVRRHLVLDAELRVHELSAMPRDGVRQPCVLHPESVVFAVSAAGELRSAIAAIARRSLRTRRYCLLSSQRIPGRRD